MKKIVFFVIAILFALAALSLYLTWTLACRDNTSGGKAVIYVQPGTTLGQLNSILDSAVIIRNIKGFKLAAKIRNLDGTIKPGRYEINPGMSNKELVRMFRLGLQKPHNLTLSGNIRSLEKLASVVSQKISADSASVLEVLEDKQLIDSLGFTPESFPGMFLLNTYEVYWTSTPQEIVRRLHREYSKFWNEQRNNLASKLGLTPQEVTTLASIVAEESNLASEHPVIAGVYLNRLKKGMPLQADPTIKYALNDPSIKRILYKHLEVDSPYNTYKRGGLPPGPITIPAPSVIDAVLNHSNHNYLYFCAKPSLDGSHSFATTLSQHNRNAAAYQAAIRRLNL